MGVAYKVGLNPTDGGGGDVGRRNPMEEDRMRHDITSHSYQIEEKENSEEARIISLKITEITSDIGIRPGFVTISLTISVLCSDGTIHDREE